jgi:thiol-disulfide isomerase/thioredoxin
MAGGCLLACGSTRAAASATSIETTLLDGRRFSTEDVRGKVLLVNFWATWCAPCRAEMPVLEAYYLAHRAEGFELLALSVDELADELKVREVTRDFRFPVAMAKSSRLSGFKAIWRMPVSSVLDRDGRLVRDDWFMGSKVDAATLDAVIRPLL